LEKLHLPEGLSLAEIHTHTLASDGIVSSSELICDAANAGVKVLCITDHDSMSATPADVDLGASMGVDVVHGEEVTTSFPPGIHILGLFLTKQVRMHMSIVDTVDAIHEQGGLVVVPHPFMPTWFASMGPRRLLKLMETHAVDGIEIRHPWPVLPGTWRYLDGFYARHQERLGAAVAGSDAHYGRIDLMRRPTLFPGTTAADLRKAIIERATSPLVLEQKLSPTLAQRISQHKRGNIWFPAQRRKGLVGWGVGPTKSIADVDSI
jgi:hypothetical protein